MDRGDILEVRKVVRRGPLGRPQINCSSCKQASKNVGRPGKVRQGRDGEVGVVAQNLRLQGSPASGLGVKVIVLVFRRASWGQHLP